MTREHRWTIDSLEESFASVEVDGRQMMHVPKWMLPRGARQGDVLAVRHEVTAEHSVLNIEVDESGTAEARQASADQLQATPTPGKGSVKP